MTRISRQDWLAAGLETLAAEGVAGLTIDALMQKLKVTKGSFYHHFRNYEAFKNALLEFWEEQYTRRIVEFSEKSQEPGEVFARFVSILSSESPEVEIAIRSWAFQDEQVRAYLLRIDAVRVDHARRWFEQVGKEEGQAAQLGRMLNMVLIGSYSVFPPTTGEDLRDMIQSFLNMVGIRV